MKRVNRGAGLGLEIPMNYTFYGDARVVLWLEKASMKITDNVDAKVAVFGIVALFKEYLQYHEFYRFIFFRQVGPRSHRGRGLDTSGRYAQVNFKAYVHAVPRKCVRYNKCPL